MTAQTPDVPQTLRLGTRGSLLAKTQSRLVADALEEAHGGLVVDLVVIKTSGDAITDRPLHEAGGKGLFTKELELALIASQIDLAVHSFKDVPVTMPLVDESALTIAAVPRREDPRDLLVSAGGLKLSELPANARVGTTSLRRRAQLLEARADLRIEPLRGNIDTRLRKLKEGQFDAIVLAMAGVRRVGLFDSTWMSPLEADQVLCAPGQGALALQCRRDDVRTLRWLTPLNDPETARCVAAEREVVRRLGGDCHSPIAAFARSVGPQVLVKAAVGNRDGQPPVIRAEAAENSAERAAEKVCESLIAAGALDALRGK